MKDLKVDLIDRASGDSAGTHPAYKAIRRHAFPDVLREHRRSRPDMLAAVDGELRLTWSQLDTRVNMLATALINHGLECGDRILWLGQNSVKLFELILAAGKFGAFVVPGNWRLSESETRSIVDDLDPKIVFWQHSEVGESYLAARLEESRGRRWCQLDGVDGDCFDAFLAEGADSDPLCDVDPDEPLLGIYTAAFDGRPAAALLSHNALMLQAMVAAQGQSIEETSRYLVSGPMFHVGVLMGALGAYMRGAVQVYVPRIAPESLMQAIERERVTHAYIPQPTARDLQRLAPGSGHDLSSLFRDGDPANWRSTLVMPEAAPAASRPGGYGQTEVAGYLTQPWFGGDGTGRPHPLAQVKIVDEAGNELPPGETGEIVVRGPMVMSGYYNRNELNDERSRSGWHRTRDLGVRHPDGSIGFVGPMTKMIKSASENIYPAEVEACLLRHPGVAAACVIGVPDPDWDQNVKAIVVRSANATVTDVELAEYCRANMASYKKPKEWAFVDELPTLPGGTVDREAADDLYGGGGYPSRGISG